MGDVEPFDWSPEVDLVKGLLLPARVQLVLDYLEAVSKRASARRRMFVRTVVDDGAFHAEDLAIRLRDDPEFAALFETALDASARSAHDVKVKLLARVVAQAASDNASVDEAELVVATIRELEPVHVRALAILGENKRQHPDATGVAAVIEGMAGLRTRRPGRVSGSSTVIRTTMGASDDIADAISATLERQGLIWNDPPGFDAWSITEYGRRILRLLKTEMPAAS